MRTTRAGLGVAGGAMLVLALGLALANLTGQNGAGSEAQPATSENSGGQIHPSWVINPADDRQLVDNATDIFVAKVEEVASKLTTSRCHVGTELAAHGSLTRTDRLETLMDKQHFVRLTAAERKELSALIRREHASTFAQTRARILLHADVAAPGPHRTDVDIAAAVGVTPRTVARVRSQYGREGLGATLTRHPRFDRRPRKLAGEREAYLMMLASSDPPPGRARWTVRLLTERLVKLEVVDHIAPETVRRALKKTRSSRG